METLLKSSAWRLSNIQPDFSPAQLEVICFVCGQKQSWSTHQILLGFQCFVRKETQGYLCVCVGLPPEEQTFMQRYNPLKKTEQMFVACVQLFFHIQRKAMNSEPKNNKVLIKNSRNSSWRHVICPYMYTDCFAHVCLCDPAHFCV